MPKSNHDGILDSIQEWRAHSATFQPKRKATALYISGWVILPLVRKIVSRCDIFFSFMHPSLGVSLQSFLFLIWDKVPERCSHRGPFPRTFGGSSRRPPGAWWCSVPPMRRGRCRWSPSALRSQAPRPKESTASLLIKNYKQAVDKKVEHTRSK